METTTLECQECGEVFEAVLGVADWEIECPGCGSSDVDLAPNDEWQDGIDTIREREGREDRMSDRSIYNEGRLDAYDE